jgi:hypothetical protein
MSEPHEQEWTPGLVLKHIMSLIAANDVRYQQRFEGQEKALKDALAAQEKAVNAALANSEKAILVAEQNAEKWRANANEWRAAMTDREAAFVSRREYDTLKESFSQQKDDFTAHVASGKGMRDLWGWIVAAIVAVAALLGIKH